MKRGGRRPEKEGLDPSVYKRLLRFLNNARTPEDLAYLPQNQIRVAPEHTLARPDMHEPVEPPPRERLFDVDLARRLLSGRDRAGPLYGFTHIDQLKDIFGREFAKHIELLSMHLGPTMYGEWRDVGTIQDPGDGTSINVAHAALLHTGKVLFIEACLGRVSRIPLWNAANRARVEITLPAPPSDNLYCSGHAFLSDGRLLVVGGGGDTNQQYPKNMAWIFDPSPGIESWSSTRDATTENRTYLNHERWYPTAVTLGDEPGRVLIASGDLASLTCSPSTARPAMPMEIYSETTGRFADVTTAADKYFRPTYPGLHLLPGGEVFFAPVGFRDSNETPDDCSGNEPSAYFTFAPTDPQSGSWNDVGLSDRTKGMSVLLLSPTYPFVQVMTSGGGNADTSRTYRIINLSTLSPGWQPPVNLPTVPGQAQPAQRIHPNVVLLPDGTVFLSGGAPASEPSWVYNPAANAWSEMAEPPRERRYHSVALLLPTGEVMSTGWTDNWIEVFRPPYLYRGAQPVIDSVPSPIHHGQPFTIQTPQASDIAKVVLVRPMAVTHQTDTEQRVVQLSFSAAGPTALSASAPDGWHPHATAPRGWYMLFILSGAGVPSVGEFVQLH